MGFNFVGGDLDQGFLLPPDMREWLDPGDLAFFVSDAVAQFDLAEFTASYRRDGRGGAAYDPQMMVALLLFAYCEGVKSSRQIERRCRRDVAYRVLSSNQQPDHSTIARFRDRHRAGLRAVFVQVLRLCAEAGLVRVGLVALDGTKLRADASGLKNYDIDRADTAIGQVEKQIEELLTAAARTDAAEDAAEHDKHDDPPAQLRQRQHRLAALRAARDRLAAQAAEVQRVQDQRRADYDAARGKRGVRPAVRPTERALAAARRTNLTDPDSRVMHIAGGLMQSFNAQAVVTSGQIVVAAEVVPQAVDYDAFHPMLDAARVALDQAGVNERIRAVVADAGYSSKNNRDHVRAPGDRPIALVAVPTLGGNKQPDNQDRPDPRFSKDRAFDRAARRITNPAGRRLYARRKIIIEPVFGQMKQRSGPRVQHRGRDKVNTEWKMMAAAHNLLKCWRHLRTVQPAY